MKKFKSLAVSSFSCYGFTAVPANIQAAKKVKLSKKTVSVDSRRQSNGFRLELAKKQRFHGN